MCVCVCGARRFATGHFVAAAATSVGWNYNSHVTNEDDWNFAYYKFLIYMCNTQFFSQIAVISNIRVILDYDDFSNNTVVILRCFKSTIIYLLLNFFY